MGWFSKRHRTTLSVIGLSVVLAAAACTPATNGQMSSAATAVDAQSGGSSEEKQSGTYQLSDPECQERQSADIALDRIVLAVNDAPVGGAEHITESAEIEAALSSTTGLTSLGRGEQERLHIIAGGDGYLLAASQNIGEATRKALTPVGLWNGNTFTPLTSDHLRNEYSGEHAAAYFPLIGSVNRGYATWFEQIVSEDLGMPTSSMIEWRILTAPLHAGAQVTQVADSQNVSGKRQTPMVTSWRPPVTDGTSVYFEAAIPDGQMWKSQIFAAEIGTGRAPKVLSDGILPTVDHEGKLYWIEKTEETPSESHAQYSLYRDGNKSTSFTVEAGYRPVWLEVTLHNDWVLTLQDACTADTYIGYFSVSSGNFTDWIHTQMDSFYATTQGSTYLWGNGTGNTPTNMFMWDFDTRKVMSFNQNLGYAIPFLRTENLAWVPEFPQGQIPPRVVWNEIRIE